ncbi:hypothetical protein QQ045_029764 [Rhodiola kirilowii]
MMQPGQYIHPLSLLRGMDLALSDADFTDFDMCNLLKGLEFPSVNFTAAASEIFTPGINFQSSGFEGDFTQAQVFDTNLEFGYLEEFQIDVPELELYGSDDTDEISMLWDDCVESFSSVENINASSLCTIRDASVESTSSPIQSSVLSLEEDIDVDKQLSLLHLLKAHAEASDMEQTELVEVIQRRILEKANPLGETLERFSFYFFQSQEQQYDHLRQESQKNFETAFKAFYHIFPFGKFAHFASNSAILEAMPADAETLNIIDFDIGEGIQWAPMIETLGQKNKALNITSIKWEEGSYSDSTPSHWSFENTKRMLICHATSVGVNLTVQEVEVGDLVSEIKKRNKRGGTRDWLAFNCQVGLPHMGRVRSHETLIEFLKIAKGVIADATSGSGIITLGDGEEAFNKVTRNSDYSTFFNGRLAHSQALLQAADWIFTDQLAEGKMTMECLFMAPNLSSLEWLQQWRDLKEHGELLGLEGVKLSQMTLLEANGLLREGEELFGVRLGGLNENEMTLEWKGISLVKVSTWR